MKIGDKDRLERYLLMRSYLKMAKPTRPSAMLDYIFSILVALDQLANAICGGNPDMTISARIGQFAPGSRYWHTLERLVDWGFEPWQGPSHCRFAYMEEKGRSDRQGSAVAQAVLSALLWAVIPPFGVAVRIAVALRKAIWH